MSETSRRDRVPDDLSAPFIFVPAGGPDPTAWKAAHPNWVRIPAQMVPRSAAPSGVGAIAGSAAVAQSGVAADLAGDALETLGADVMGPLGVLLSTLFAPTPIGPEFVDGSHPYGEGLNQAHSIPPLPGSSAPPTAGERPEEGGFTSAPVLPSPPGLEQAQPLPSIPALPDAPTLPGGPPGQAAEGHGPTIFTHDREEERGPPGTRTRSQRARKAARTSDPEVTQALSGDEWRAHHLINLAGRRLAPEVIDGAAKAGWQIDSPGNIAPLPASPDAQRKLKASGIDRPVHDSGHRDWNKEVETRLEKIQSDLESEGILRGTDRFNVEARKALEKLQDELRLEMRGRKQLTLDVTNEQPDPV